MSNFCIYCGNDIKNNMSLPVYDENFNETCEYQCKKCFEDNLYEEFAIVPWQHYHYTIPGINICYEDDYRDALGRIYYTTNEKAMKKMFSGLIVCDPPKRGITIMNTVHMRDAMERYVISCDPIENKTTIIDIITDTLVEQKKLIHIICGVPEPLHGTIDKLKEEYVYIIKKSPEMPLIDYTLFREPKLFSGPRRGKRKGYTRKRKK